MGFKLGQEVIDKLREKKEEEKHLPEKTLPLPHEEKMAIVKECFKNNDCKVFVETGTYLGETTEVLSSIAEKVYTIELSQDLHKQAVEKFKNNKNVECLQGDSTTVLPKILKKIKEKPLFWLDGHYSSGITAQGSKDTPINEELEAICAAKLNGAVILIDDARCFGVEKDYPTIEALSEKAKSLFPNCKFTMGDDIIRIIV